MAADSRGVMPASARAAGPAPAARSCVHRSARFQHPARFRARSRSAPAPMSTPTISGDGGPPSGWVISSSIVSSPTLRFTAPGSASRATREPINVAGQECMQRRLHPLIVTIAHQRPFCTAAATRRRRRCRISSRGRSSRLGTRLASFGRPPHRLDPTATSVARCTARRSSRLTRRQDPERTPVAVPRQRAPARCW